MTERAKDILAAELRGSTAEFLGWLTGLKPPADRESIPHELRPAFDKMLGRICAAAETFAASNSEMRAFGASDAACYKWPGDTPEHKALRAAYIEGAAACGDGEGGNTAKEN